MNLRALFFPPRAMPEPNPRCRRYTRAETAQLLRNFDQQVRMSRALHQPPQESKKP